MRDRLDDPLIYTTDSSEVCVLALQSARAGDLGQLIDMCEFWRRVFVVEVKLDGYEKRLCEQILP